MDGYVLTDKLTPRQFSEMIDLDIDTTKLLYSVYAAENADYSKLITNMNDYSVPIIDMFMFVYDLKSDGYVQLDGELGDSIDDLYAKLIRPAAMIWLPRLQPIILSCRCCLCSLLF